MKAREELNSPTVRLAAGSLRTRAGAVLRTPGATLAALALLAAVSAASCGDPARPSTDSMLTVHLMTGGEDLASGYILVVDNQVLKAVGATAVVPIPGRRGDQKTVELRGLPTNCAPTDDAPLTRVVLFQDDAALTFNITCVRRQGTIAVSTQTTGEALPSAYTVLIEGEAVDQVAANGQLEIPNLVAGLHMVAIAGVPPNCTGTSSAQLAVTHAATTIVNFAFSCAPDLGGVRISVTTSGVEPDLNGYSGAIAGRIVVLQSNGTAEVNAVATGTHVLNVTGIAPNCTLVGGAPTIEVAVGEWTQVALQVFCSVSTGAIRVTTQTTGVNPPSGNYTILFDPWGYEPALPIGTNATVLLTNRWIGVHYIALAGLADHCVMNDSDVRWASVTPGDTVDVHFDLSCRAVGQLRVEVQTTGIDHDQNGYTVEAAGARRSALLGPQGSKTFTDFPEGTHQIQLHGVAHNCQIAAPADMQATVVEGAETVFGIVVHCVPLGSIQVNVLTPEGGHASGLYDLKLTGAGVSRTEEVQINGSATFDKLPSATPLTVAITGVPPNCTAQPEKSTVTVPAETIVMVNITVTCAAATTIAFAAPGNDLDIYTVMSDGSDLRRITFGDGDDTDPAWSPDGRIAFTGNRAGERAVYVINADGSHEVRLTAGSGSWNPAWSPDGSRIAFVSDRDGNAEIYVMNADGTGVQRLTFSTANEDDPAWSPDGMKLAFVRFSNQYSNLGVMNIDGTGIVMRNAWLVMDRHPEWSPDGLWISYGTRDMYYPLLATDNIHTINSTLTMGAPVHANGKAPTWSPNGEWLAYAGNRCGPVECTPALMAVRPGGSHTPVTLMALPAYTPAWRR